MVYSQSGIEVEAGQTTAEVEFTPQGLIKRDHKRGKHWGKKNKKLRDKNPYGDVYGSTTGAIAAFSTNRNNVLGNIGKVSNKPKRNDPVEAYGTKYTRPQYPHHQQSSESESKN